YSAGIVLFELACARPLFHGKGKEVLDAVRAGAIPRPTSVDPNMPPALEEIILRALAYHADDRYQTARDLQHALGPFPDAPTPATVTVPARACRTRSAGSRRRRRSRGARCTTGGAPRSSPRGWCPASGPGGRPPTRFPRR